MIDQNSQFMAILTAVGEAKQANASAMGIPWTFSQMGVGDASGTDPQPDRAQTKLINERHRAPLNQVSIDPKNTNVIIAEQVIPETVGGWWIREIGLYDADGDLVAVANCAPSFKPQLAQGSGKTQVVRINFIVTSAANVTLKIDPSVVLATRKYVDDRLIEVLPPTRKPGSYTQVTINKYGVVTEGSNPETLAESGIKDAYTKEQIDGALKLKAPLASPVFSGKPTVPTPALNANDQQVANTAYVQAVVAAVIGGAPGALDTLKELAAALGGDPNFANTIINALAGKADKATTLAGYGVTDAYTVTQTDSLLKLKASLASPALTGKPTAPTPVLGSNDQQVANAAFVQATVAAVISGAPGALDTLKELADALGGDPNFANTIVNALTLKANKADVLPLAGGEMTGNITLLNGRSVLLIAQDTNSWASGLLCRGKLGNEALGGLGIWGNRETVNCAYMGLGSSPWTTGNGVRVTANGVDVTGPLSGDGSGLTNLKWSALESTPTDLGAYGVTFASQNDAEAGKETGKPMSPLRVFQAITAKVIQATENIVGIARIASQVLVNLGEDDASIVTPRKLRFGLSYLLGVNGYYVFPTWMGGLIIQWGLASSVGQASTGAGPYRDVTLPIAFPIACLGVQASMNFSAMTTSSAHSPGATIVSKSVIRLQNNYTSSAGEIMYFAIGL